MKKIIILSVLAFMSCQLFSQSQYKYSGGNIIVGKNVKYICKSQGHPYLVRIDNINNKDTTNSIYYNNGKKLGLYDEVGASSTYERKDLNNVAKLIFTKSELKILKDNRIPLLIDFTTNKKGVTIEIGFTFMKNAPVLETLNPDRFYELENKLKQVIKMNISKADQNVRNPKWMESIDFWEIK